MSKWIDATAPDRQQSAHIIAEEKNISDAAVEKDWWVTAILKVLFTMSPSNYMFFKGGTSLSKGWNIIDRFSEDIDITLYRDFYSVEQKKECAKVATNNQIKNLRIANRDYVTSEFANELKVKLNETGLDECSVMPITHKDDGTPIDHDSDPVVIEIHYTSRLKTDLYVRPIIKIEVSCLSMKEPFENKRIISLIGDRLPHIDNETVTKIPTITPTRTFLEKAFLLNEEYQRNSPRTERMSRHLYDLERLMDTPFANEALANMPLYNEIIEHRRKFYHIKGVNYNLNLPSTINFCPTGDIYDKMKLDYEVMKDSMIYGDRLQFTNLITRLEELLSRFRMIEI